jgi:hypothetical protein
MDWGCLPVPAILTTRISGSKCDMEIVRPLLGPKDTAQGQCISIPRSLEQLLPVKI